ncbi:N-acetylmuramoyl-L-alanine amidase AmiA precursor [Roseovarius albus]|uniref:N-acetylmuramoyl-L-alanine amidase n=1 Tax=Roseovarius albus TaxID=1247867 RepID=A0A1X6YB39_9RHOB|nr:N-acetylmuramoyl-L-alanine amidase [Roseovarius albus]SLN16032.1 N-acetylmuramoyl-L-alanine amidase AmiA precursor [Roseovarius albus]
MIRIILACILWCSAFVANAQDFSGLARLQGENNAFTDKRGGVQLDLTLTQGVPWRVFTLDNPPRLVVDFREIDWQGVEPEALDQSDRVTSVRVGGFKPGWSRMIANLAGPYGLETASLSIDDLDQTAQLEVILAETSAEDFRANSGSPKTPGWEQENASNVTATKQKPRDNDPMRIVIDPGHGGLDPGAEKNGSFEKDLMLAFAKDLKEALVRTGEFEVYLTRDDDRFVSLERRVAIAHQVNAEVFLSVHADALREGQARGATVYTLSKSASDKASAALVERHNRADMLAGVDLTDADDVVADVLIDLARLETQPRTQSLAGILHAQLRKKSLPLHPRPVRQAGFSVLKSPDIPSILLELGFLSNQRDFENISNPEWRATMVDAVRDALVQWRAVDAVAVDLLRQ